MLRELPEAGAYTVLVVAVLFPPPVTSTPPVTSPGWVIAAPTGGTAASCTASPPIILSPNTSGPAATTLSPAWPISSPPPPRTARPEDIGHATTGSSTGRLLLCTDGIGKSLAMPAIKSILADATSGRTAAETLVESALATGGTDNTTTLVADACPLP
ncbi:hypothetical protein ACQP1O_22655 [Nocardia sp. CA-151230]|uniref:hypothetical protein n=1 Tax=Nocardia sp. CA-151230 TaxID=3239982 RepID=UPI003D94DFB8